MFARVASSLPRRALAMSRRNLTLGAAATGSALRTVMPQSVRALHVAATCLSKHEFKAETRQLLDIVASSLYRYLGVCLERMVSSLDSWE
jgi:uncharacterized membrane protein